MSRKLSEWEPRGTAGAEDYGSGRSQEGDETGRPRRGPREAGTTDYFPAASPMVPAWEKARKRVITATERPIRPTKSSARLPEGFYPVPEIPANSTTPAIAGKSKRPVVPLSAAVTRAETPRAAVVHARYDDLPVRVTRTATYKFHRNGS